MKFADDLSIPIRPHPNYGIREVESDSVDAISVGSNRLLFHGEYLRDGADLIVRGDGETLIVHDYFTAAHRPKLVAPNGASLSEAVIDALARPVDGVEVAQAGPPPASDASAAIGRVQTLSGSATAVRNGVSVALQVGDLVYKGDVVQTGAGASLAIAFLDGTLFSLAANARMVLSEMVYSANGADNHSLFNLVQGSIHFVAGKVAKTGDMKVGTPLATMGIRGTYVGAEIDANDGTSRVSVITEPPTPEHPDGHTGAFDVYSGQDTGNLLFRVTDPNAVWTVGPDGSGGVSFRSDPKTAEELAREAQLAKEVFRTLAEVPRLPVPGPSTGGGGGSGNQPGQFEPNPTAPSTGPGNPGPTLPPGPPGPGPLPPGPTPPPSPNGLDAPPLVTGPSDPGTGLALNPRSVALAQGDVREGLGAQSLLAGTPGAQLIAVRGPASTQDVPITGTVTLHGRYGILTLHGDGTYSYRAVYAAALGEGQSGADVFGLTVGRGSAIGSTTLSFDVTGKNDAPVVSGPTIGQAGEDGAAVRLSALAHASDVDAGTQLGVVGVPAELPSGVSYDATTRTFRLDPSNAAYQSLAAGQTRTVTVSYGVSDGIVTTPATVSWTVTGVNDAPVVTGTVGGTATEGGAVVRLSALANASDVDAGTRLQVVDVPAELPPGVRYDAATKTFHLDPSDAAYQSLAAGQTRTVTVGYGVSDGIVTTPASVSWAVTGANDAPVVTGAVTGSAMEDGVMVSLSALANASDIDAGARLDVVAVPTELPPGVTYDAATKTFRLDPSDAAYQTLAAGQTRTVTVSYGVSDGTATTPATVSWTITGANDAPAVTGAVTGTATEDGVVVRLGALAHASDVDAGARLSVVDVPAALPPGVTYDAATKTFHLDPSNAAYQSLGAGEIRTVTVSYGVSDGTATTPATVSWIVTGVNDAPVVGGPVTGSASEDGAALRLSALANASDVDSEATLQVVGVPSALPPGVSYDAETREFRLDPSDPAYQSLAAGQTRTVTVSYGVTDGTATTPASVSWTITGANDVPVVTGPVTAAAVEGGPAVVLDALARASDVDAGTSLTVVDVPSELPPGVSYDAATHGFRLDPSDPAYQNLAAGQSIAVSVGYGVSDGRVTVPASVSWTLTGTNDAPTVAGTVTGAATEDGAVVGLSALANASDVDARTRLGVVDVPSELPPGVLYDTATQTFRLDPSDPAYQSLAAGETRTVTISYGVSDGSATTPASVSWTVTGTNDAPTVAAALTRDVREGAAASSLDLLAGAGDADAGDSLTVDGVTYAVDGAAATANAPAGLRLVGARLTLDPSDPAFEALAQGETRTIVVRYTIEDGHGGTVAQSATLTITGTNDPPVVAGPVTGSASEDGAEARLDALANASDVDAGTRLRVVDLPTELPPGVSCDANTGEFRLDPSDAAYQNLAAGQTRTVTVSYGVSDGIATTPASVAWTVTGVNDAPVVNGRVTGTAVEDGAPVSLSALALATDVDTGTRLQVVDVPSELPPGVSYDAGTQSFRLDPSDLAYQSLAVGETRTVTVSYGVTDGSATTPASVAWTVTGVNDAPVVSGLVTGAAGEDGVVVRLSAMANAADVDAGTQLRVVGVPSALPPGVSYDAGTGMFQLDPSDPAYQSLAAGQTRTVTVSYGVTDGSATTPASVSWTITGMNDAPAVSSPVTGTAVEDGGPVSLSALARASDVDAGTRLGVVDLPAELPPGVSYDASTQSFRLDPSDATYQSLAAGQTRTVTVTYGVSDGTATTPASVSWTVTGVNDAPVVGGPVVGTAGEDGPAVALDALARASDVDVGTSLRVVNLPSELPPGVSYDAETGTFRLDPSGTAYQNLAAGQTRTVTVNYGVSDGTTTTPASVAWTVTGVNDAPVVTGPVTGIATEDGAAVRLSALANASDVDTGTQLRVVGVPSALPPGVSYDAETGEFRLDPSAPAYQSLAAGQTRTVTVSYGVTDGIATTPASVAWTVTGVNDAPVVSGPVTGAASEDGAAVRLSALANASDIDAGAQLQVVDVPATLPPGVSYDAETGTFRLDPSNAAYQSLAVGETRTITVSYGVSDGIATTPASVSWTVTGVNDAPVVSSPVTGTAGEDGVVVRLSALANASDIDAGTQLQVIDVPSALPPGVSYDAEAREFRLDPSDPAYQSLAAGQTRTVSVTYGVTDGTATTPASVSWTVTGANDAPVVTGAVGGTAIEDGAVVRLSALANASDVDAGTSLTVVDVPAELPPGVRYDAATQQFSLDPSDIAYQSLAAGQTRTVTVTYAVSDGSAATAASVSWTVIGVNDAPAVTGAVSGFASEDGTAVRLSALANASDIDAGTQLNVVGVPTELPPGVVYDPNTQSFRLDPSDPAYQSLAAGQTRTVTVSYGVSDGTATTPASVSWTVTGVNDAPVVGGPVVGMAGEDGPAVALGALARASDVDAGTALQVVSIPSELPPGVSFDAATNEFRLDPSNAAYQSLAAGETRTITVSYGVSDGSATTAASVSWTVTGVNDAPVVSGPVTGTATEDGAAVRLSALAHASDVDAGSQLAVVNVPTELPPGISFDAATNEFRLDPSNAAYQSLAAGETRTITVSYGVSDGTATTSASVSWTVTGVNDAPVVSGPATGSATEDGAAVRLSALANASDIDAGTQLGIVNVPAELPPGVSYDAATKAFRLDPSVAAYQSLAAGQTQTVTVSYGVSDGTTTTPASVSWTVTGTNDAPTAGGDRTILVGSGGSVTLQSGDLQASDPDLNAGPFTYRVESDANPHGYFSIGEAIVTQFTQADINAGRVVYHRDGTLAGHDSDTVAFILDDGAGGLTQGGLTVTVTGPYTLQDNVVRASDDTEGDLDIPIEALLFNDRGTRPLTATDIADPSGSHVGTVGDRTVTVTPEASTQPNGAFTYRAEESGGQTGNAATVFVNVSTTSGETAIAVGAGQDDDVLFASRNGATILNGNDPELSGGAARTGHDVYVFTQTPSESGDDPIHEIAGFSAAHDAIALPFLNVAADGGPAEPEGIDGLVRIRGSAEHGYDLLVSWNLARGFQPIAHFDAGTLGTDEAVTVIWNGRSAAVAVTQNSAPTVAEPLTSETQEGAEAYGIDLAAGASDADGDALAPTNLRYAVDGQPTEGIPWGLSLDGTSLVVDPGHENFSDLAEGQTRTIVIDYTLDDGHGGTVAQSATITVTGTDAGAPDAPLPTQADNVVLASDSGAEGFTIPVEALLFNDVGADGVRPSYFGITAVTPTDTDRYAASVSSGGGTVTVSPTPDSAEPEGAFTYRAYDGTDRGSDTATVRVSKSVGTSDDTFVAHGSGERDDILFAAIDTMTSTRLDGNVNGLTGAERSGHDVFVFTQAPAESGVPVHDITDLFADNDAVDLTFLDGSGASAETIGEFVTVQASESGYDLYARVDPESGLYRIAHIDAIHVADGADPFSGHTLTVIWRDHLASVAIPDMLMA